MPKKIKPKNLLQIELDDNTYNRFIKVSHNEGLTTQEKLLKLIKDVT